MKTLRSLVLVVTLALLVSLNLTVGRAKTVVQADFENWLSAKENAFHQSENPGQMTPVSIKLISNDPSRRINLLLSSTASAEGADQVLRVLGLMREADLFSLADRIGGKAGESLSLVVEDSGRVFSTEVSGDVLKESVQARTMLKLMQVFAAQNPGQSGAQTSEMLARASTAADTTAGGNN